MKISVDPAAVELRLDDTYGVRWRGRRWPVVIGGALQSGEPWTREYAARQIERQLQGMSAHERLEVMR